MSNKWHHMSLQLMYHQFLVIQDFYFIRTLLVNCISLTEPWGTQIFGKWT